MVKKGLVLLPIPAAGHLKPMVEMATELLKHHNNGFSVTILLMKPIPGLSEGPNYTNYIHSISSSGFDISFEELPLIEPPSSDEEPGSPVFISLYIQKLLPYITSSISGVLSITPSATLIIDFFATTAIDEVKKLGVPTFLFFTARAAMLAFMIYGPVYNKNDQLSIELPGMEPIPSSSLPKSSNKTNSSSSSLYSWLLYQSLKFLETKGMIINTFTALEGKVVKCLEDGVYVHGRPTPPVYPVGPIISFQNEEKEQHHETIKWLDGQEAGSVVFLCFGSMGTFTSSQIKEIGLGLEQSGHRFLWSVRGPLIPAGRLPVELDQEVLPEGFMERTRDRGFVWPSSVPQSLILGHRAVGGFVTHCGWNSVLESLWNGVPMLTWPLYAEQHLNAYQMVKDHGLAVELRVDRRDEGFVSAEEVEKRVRVLMGDSEEVKKVKERTREMMVESRRALKEGGSSFVSFQRLAQELQLAHE